MPDRNDIPGYDAWKTSGPDDERPRYLPDIKDVELSVRIYSTRKELDPDELAKKLRKQILELLEYHRYMGDDIDVDIDTASTRPNEY